MSLDLVVPHGIDAVRETFGDPESFLLVDGSVSPRWPQKILGSARLPFPLFLSWVPGQTVTRIGCHRLIVPAVEGAFEELRDADFGKNRPITPSGNRINEYGGCYAWRAVRGSARKPSMHSWAIALDLDPVENALGKEPKMDPEAVAILERHGFRWGGRFARQDGMHFQYATGC